MALFQKQQTVLQKQAERTQRELETRQRNLELFKETQKHVHTQGLHDAMAGLAQITVGHDKIIELPYNPFDKPIVKLAFVVGTKRGSVYEKTGKRVETSVRWSDGWSSGRSLQFEDQVRPSAPRILQDEFQLHVSMGETPPDVTRYLKLEFHLQRWVVENGRLFGPDIYKLSHQSVPGGDTSVSIENNANKDYISLDQTLEELFVEGYEFLQQEGVTPR